MTEYTHVTLNKGAGATVVRVHNTNPLLDFWVARDHGSDEFEISVSIAGSLAGEKAVRLNLTQPRNIEKTAINDPTWRQATDVDYPQVTSALRRYRTMRELLMLAVQD